MESSSHWGVSGITEKTCPTEVALRGVPFRGGGSHEHRSNPSLCTGIEREHRSYRAVSRCLSRSANDHRFCRNREARWHLLGRCVSRGCNDCVPIGSGMAFRFPGSISGTACLRNCRSIGRACLGEGFSGTGTFAGNECRFCRQLVAFPLERTTSSSNVFAARSGERDQLSSEDGMSFRFGQQAEW